MMGKKLFISYNHEQRDWVKNSLLPILKACETEYFIDLERMKGGRPITTQTDKWQDEADIQVLLFSKAYIESDYCTHELEKALGYDPHFTNGKILPLKLEECELPDPFSSKNVFWIDFKPPTPDSWEKFFSTCDIPFSACAFEWLKARDKVVRYLDRRESVNLILKGETCWKKLLKHLKDDYPYKLKEIDFDTWGTTSRKGFVKKVLHSWKCDREVPDLLGTIRESIQNHRNITWMFAGSHDITELRNANWTSYLISARTIEVPFYTLDETNLLLTDPLKHSRLLNQSSIKRPRFSPGFWGPGGIEEIHKQSGGWPFFVQLIAETVIDMLNDSNRTGVNKELLELALDESIDNGRNAFLNLVKEESLLPGELEYLEGFCTKEKCPLPGDKNVLASLLRRKLVVEKKDYLMMRIPLIHRWIRKRWM